MVEEITSSLSIETIFQFFMLNLTLRLYNKISKLLRDLKHMKIENSFKQIITKFINSWKIPKSHFALFPGD